jgi:rsbT co-antagonist protein RsbR
VERRRVIGVAHARIGLPLPTYFAAMNLSLKLLTESMYDGSLSHMEYANSVRAISKLVHLDTAIVVDTFSVHTNRIIAEQSQTLMEMSTPVTAIWDGILMLPVVGIIDSKRAQDIMNAMLSMIADTKAKVFILDISGVAVVDTAVANHLIKITKATKLMGCECTISGVSPAIAQTVVELGIDVGNVSTTANLRDALTYAFRKTGVEIRKVS